MLRLFIFILVRFFIIALAIYVGLTLLKKVLQFFQVYFRQPIGNPPQGSQQKPKQNYDDVKDAKFVELPNNKTEDKQDSST